MTDTSRPYVNVYEPDENGVEQLVYRQMNDDEYAAWQTAETALTTEQQAQVTAAWAELRAIRDRWLAQTDYIDLYLANPQTFTIPAAIGTALSSNSTAWQTWRQALRDLPEHRDRPRRRRRGRRRRPRNDRHPDAVAAGAGGTCDLPLLN